MNTSRDRGFTLVELLVGISVLALLLAIGAPSFATWMQSSQIRSQAESILNGLQLAQADAVKRNAPVRFELMSTLDNSCAPLTTGRNWIVSMDGATGACASTNMADAAAPAPPRVIQRRAGIEGSRNAAVAASQSSIVFTGLGRVNPVPAGNITINVTNPTGGTCVADGGPMRCLRIVVSPTGQVRMCDPAAGGSDPRACPA